MESLRSYFIRKYYEACDIVTKIENGTWKEYPEIANMSLAEIEACTEVKSQLEQLGILPIMDNEKYGKN